MEGSVIELLEDELFQDINLTGELSLSVKEKLDELISQGKLGKKTVEELKEYEGNLTTQLNKLKEENFKLDATVKAWKTTLRNKLEEFKQADLKLNEIYDKIQSEREEYFTKLDKFNEEYGILSAWWDKQMVFLSQLEKLGEKNSEQLRCKQDIKQLEEEVEEIKKQIEALQSEKQVEVEVEVHSTQDGERVSDVIEEVSPDRLATKKIRIEKGKENNAGEEEIEKEEEEIVSEPKDEMAESFYSLVNVEKVRRANRRRNRRDAFFSKIKKLVT